MKHTPRLENLPKGYEYLEERPQGAGRRFYDDRINSEDTNED